VIGGPVVRTAAVAGTAAVVAHDRRVFPGTIGVTVVTLAGDNAEGRAAMIGTGGVILAGLTWLPVDDDREHKTESA
jgi:hypothetical protein